LRAWTPAHHGSFTLTNGCVQRLPFVTARRFTLCNDERKKLRVIIYWRGFCLSIDIIRRWSRAATCFPLPRSAGEGKTNGVTGEKFHGSFMNRSEPGFFMEIASAPGFCPHSVNT
jgi:hypothetical protein